MPAWSTDIADQFIEMAAREGNAFTQMHLQELVYIAHGWCLALTGQPLTGDRPEAHYYGPEYRRLAAALGQNGSRPVVKQIELGRDASRPDAFAIDQSLEPDERAIMAQVYAEYARRPTSELASLTRADDTPWAEVYAAGAGSGRDISHEIIRRQFAEIAAKPA